MAIFAYQFPVYQPAMRIITGITNANPAVVTTSFNNQYITGTIVRIDIPPGFGMQQINGMFGTITVLSPTTFSINIDTTLFDVFSTPSNITQQAQQAQSVPIGEVTSMLTAAVQNALPYS